MALALVGEMSENGTGTDVATTEELSAALTPKQKLFAELYVTHLNAAKAARLAGYSEKTANQIGYENLTKPDIVAYVGALMAEGGMDQSEAAVRLTAMGRGDLPTSVSVTLDAEGKVVGTKERYNSRSALIDILRLLGRFEEPGSGRGRVGVIILPSLLPPGSDLTGEIIVEGNGAPTKRRGVISLPPLNKETDHATDEGDD